MYFRSSQRVLVANLVRSVFIYSCPSASPIKNRMLFSSGFHAAYRGGKVLLGDAAQYLAERKIETSDPKEIDEALLKLELRLVEGNPSESGTATQTGNDDQKAFARPKGPARRTR